ncbi:hypothetical protein Tco_1123333 [Tanacetum coccineum]|uniref:Retrotransposon protein, putative, Ty1-copia subclass n=1 Tax=Tanacetum coccineum TaxID=301880 RepID=A0ABQ5J602_9ASTR
MIDNRWMDKRLKEVLMIDELCIVETDKVNYTVETDMVKLVIEIKCFGMSFDEFDKETGSFDGMQPKQADLSCVHALNKPHLHEIHVVPNKHEAEQCDDHWIVVKKILKYLNNTKDMFLVYGGDMKRELKVSCYTDAGYLTDADDMKSQTRYVFVLNGGAVDWKSTKQSNFATSSIDAEYIAAFDASKEAIWIQKFISRLGVVPTIKEPINMYCHNIGAIAIAKGHGVTKDDNLADPFTKALAFLEHSKLTEKIGMIPASSLMLSAGESAHAEETMHTAKDLEEPAHQEFETRAIEDQPVDETRQPSDCNLAREEGPRESFDKLMDTPLDFSAFMMNQLKDDTLTPELLAGYVIQRHVEDLQLGVESYQKKLNITKPDTCRSDLKSRDAYTTYSNPRGFIYQNKDKKNKLIRIDELHKFSDGTLDDVRTALNDRLKGIGMEYLPQTIWRQSDRERPKAMFQAIDKQLKSRRIMRCLERFVGGRPYGGDLWLNKVT